MLSYQEYLDAIDPVAYHKGEWQWEEDGYTVTRGNQYTPPGCHDSCGILFYTKDGKLEKVEGDPFQPYSGGKLCMRCLDLVEAVNHPDRLKYPLRRAGERGENKWERITWDEAYDEICAKVRHIWEEHGPESIMVCHGTGRAITWQTPMIGHIAFKSANHNPVLSGWSCYMPRLVGAIAPLGDYVLADAAIAHADRYANEAWKCPEVIVVWGNEPLASNADGYLGHWLTVCVEMGAKIISVDPRLTWWGARAEYFLQLKPGSDSAMACAWLQVITSEDLVDHEFIDYWCTGYEELVESVKDYTPEWAEGITGVPAEDIRGAARLYASGNCSTIQWGLANDQQLGAMSVNLAHCAMIAICGNLDRPGGNILVHNAFEINANYASGEKFVPEKAEERKLNVRRGLGIDGADLAASAHPDACLHALEANQNAVGEDYPIDMLWLQGTNGLACAGQDAPRWREAMLKVPFNVVFDPFMTPTAVAIADIVLPAAMCCERNNARAWWFPVRATKKVTQFYEARSDEQVAVELCNLLNPEVMDAEFGWKNDIDFVQWFLDGGDGVAMGASLEGGIAEVAKGGLGMSFDGLIEKGGWAYDNWNNQYEKYAKGMLREDGGLGFNTVSGRVELCPPTYAFWGYNTHPTPMVPPENPVDTPELCKEYPLIMSCGGRSFEFFHSEHRQLKTMREFHPWPLVMVSPEDAEKYGIKDGEWTWVENWHGRFRQIAKVTPRVAPGVIHAEHGWWFPEQEGSEPNLFGTFDSNPNNVLTPFVYGHGGVGAPIKNSIVKIYPYKEGDVLPTSQVLEHGGFGDYTPGEMIGSKKRNWVYAKEIVEKEA